jgi:hypothetical protein
MQLLSHELPDLLDNILLITWAGMTSGMKEHSYACQQAMQYLNKHFPVITLAVEVH